MRVLIALALVACGSSTSPSIQSRSAAPTTPPPDVTWTNGAFDLADFPQAARSGKAVLIARVDNDGGRGNPNLAFEVRDQSDRVIDKHVVMTVDDYEHLVPDGTTPSPLLADRIRTANTWLARKHAALDLVAMRPDIARAQTVDATRWPAPKATRCAQCEPCENPPYVAGAYTAPGIFVVRIAYRGTDTCWEPSDQWHVVAR